MSLNEEEARVRRSVRTRSTDLPPDWWVANHETNESVKAGSERLVSMFVCVVPFAAQDLRNGKRTT